jgi:putative thioredoxin
MGYDLTDFETDVIERSQHVPVLVDFWAPWCGPCKTLGPVLERLASEAKGRWELVKVNTEEREELAMAFEIRSIPAVKLFRKGEVADEFVGALPEAEVRRWLEKALPSPLAGKIADARAHLTQGRRSEAAALAEKILAAEPNKAEARVLLAEAILTQTPARVAQVLAGVTDDSEHAGRARALRTLAGFLAKGTDEAGWPDAAVRPRFLAGLRALKAADFGEALPAFIQTIERDKSFADGAAQAMCKAIVQLLGVRDPIVDRHYRALSSALHS